MLGIETHEHLIISLFNAAYLQAKLPYFAGCVFQKRNALSNCVAFIDGTVIGVSRPGKSGYQHVLYNRHKRKHALKYQAVLMPDGMLLHVYGPLEGRKHDWTLYARSGLEEKLPNCMQLEEGTRFCIYGDSGYIRRWYLDTPFQGASLSPDQSSFNEAISAVRVTVVGRETRSRAKTRVVRGGVYEVARGKRWRLSGDCKTRVCSRTSETRTERSGALDPAELTNGQRTVRASGEATRDMATRVLGCERGERESLNEKG